MLNTLESSEEEEKGSQWIVDDIEEEIKTCEGGGKIPPKSEKDLLNKVNPYLSE